MKFLVLVICLRQHQGSLSAIVSSFMFCNSLEICLCYESIEWKLAICIHLWQVQFFASSCFCNSLEIRLCYGSIEWKLAICIHFWQVQFFTNNIPDSRVHGSHVCPMNFCYLGISMYIVLCCVQLVSVWYWIILPTPLGSLHGQMDNHMIATLPVKWP